MNVILLEGFNYEGKEYYDRQLKWVIMTDKQINIHFHNLNGEVSILWILYSLITKHISRQLCLNRVQYIYK